MQNCESVEMFSMKRAQAAHHTSTRLQLDKVIAAGRHPSQYVMFLV